MMKHMRILVVGAGAVGGYFGARLAQAGRDVTFLVREGRARQLRDGGLQVVTPHDRFAVEPELLLAAELKSAGQTFDLVLLSTKAYALESAMEDFAPAVGPGTLILPLLNGMHHLDVLDGRFGHKHVLGGSTRISSDLDAEGHVHMFETLQDLVYGARGNATASPLAEVTAALHDAGFDDVLSPDVTGFMWQKWTLLSAIAATTCLLRGSIGDVAAVPGGPETAVALLAESAAIAAACGYPVPEDFLAIARQRVTAKGSALTASMYRDLMRGAPVEAEQVFGDLLRRGGEHGLLSPLLRAAFVQLSVYGARRGKE